VSRTHRRALSSAVVGSPCHEREETLGYLRKVKIGEDLLFPAARSTSFCSQSAPESTVYVPWDLEISLGSRYGTLSKGKAVCAAIHRKNIALFIFRGLCCINEDCRSVERLIEEPFMLKRRCFPIEIILVCVRWYCKYGISYRDLGEMMEERGVEVDPSTIMRWVQRYASELEERVR